MLVDKIEDAKARAAVKTQIEADKKARAEKAAREKALREGQPIPASSADPSSAPVAPAALAANTSASKEHKETRLQIRLQGGQPYTTTLPVDARECDADPRVQRIHAIPRQPCGQSQNFLQDKL